MTNECPFCIHKEKYPNSRLGPEVSMKDIQEKCCETHKEKFLPGFKKYFNL